MRSIFFLLFFYFATRAVNLLVLPIFTDESSYLYTSSVISSNLISKWGATLALPTVKPPLFFIVEIFFEKISSDPLTSGRLVSVSTGCLTMLGIYFLTRRLFEKKTALLAGFLYIISPFTLTYDRLALMDSMISAFSVWILYTSVLVLERKKLIYYLSLVALCELSLLTKQSGKFFLMMLPLVPIFTSNKEKVRNILLFGLISLISYLIYYQILSTSSNFAFYSNFDKTYIDNVSLTLVKTNVLAVLSWLKSYFPLLFFVLPFILIYSFVKRREASLLIFIWAGLPIVFTIFFGRYFFPRYLLPSIIFLFPALSFSFKNFFSSKRVSLLLLLFMPSLIFDYFILIDPSRAFYHYNERAQFISEWPSGYGVREAFNRLQLIDQSKKIAVEGDNGHLFSTFNLFGAKQNLYPFKQNEKEVEIIARETKADYLLLNRKSDLNLKGFDLEWSFKREYDGDSIMLYKVKL